MRYGNQAMQIREWDWFKLQLTILALQEKAATKSISFRFEDETGKVVAMLWNEDVEQFLESRASQEDQLAMYNGWVIWLMVQIKEILKTMPTLEREFDISSLEIEILHDYGMGSSLVCAYKGGELVKWNHTHHIASTAS